MLRYDDPGGDAALAAGDVADATRILAQAALINVASETELELDADAYQAFIDRVNRVIDDPGLVITPGDLVRHAEAYALRGAQAMIADGETGFLASTWSHDQVCPLPPFC